MLKEGQVFKTKSNHNIVYDIVEGDDNLIVFLSGLMSDRKGSKATYFKNYCLEKKHSYICFDYLGHGESDLEFVQCNIEDWLNNSIEIINNFANEKKVTLIGSSLGGWLMLRIAQIIPNKINALIGLAAAPDFTEELMWDTFTQETKNSLLQGQIHKLPSDYCDGEYPITMNLIESGRTHSIFKQDKIDINSPIRLFQGMDDNDVPYSYASKIAKIITSEDIEIFIIKNANHSLSRPEDLHKITNILEDLIRNLA